MSVLLGEARIRTVGLALELAAARNRAELRPNDPIAAHTVEAAEFALDNAVQYHAQLLTRQRSFAHLQ